MLANKGESVGVYQNVRSDPAGEVINQHSGWFGCEEHPATILISSSVCEL